MEKKVENKMEKNAENKAEAPKDFYSFPEYGVSVEASSLEEANEILQKGLKEKAK